MNEYEDDDEVYYDEMPSLGEQFECILLIPWSGYVCGDVVKVHRGVYNTLLNLKQALPLNSWEDDATEHQRLVINAKNLEEENEELWETNKKLHDKVLKLEDEVKSYETNKTKTKKKTKRKTTSKKKTAKELS
jgi:hypothetical protein